MKNLCNKIFIFFILVSGCVKKNTVNTIINKQNNWNYNIGIEGIECKLCAYSTVKRLEKIEHIKNVKIICNSNFKECYASLEYTNIGINIDLKNIINSICYQGFEVTYISGNFIGIFDAEFNNFNLDSSIEKNIKFINFDKKTSNIQANQKIVVNAKLVFNKKTKEIWMTLN